MNFKTLAQTLGMWRSREIMKEFAEKEAALITDNFSVYSTVFSEIVLLLLKAPKNWNKEEKEGAGDLN